MHPWRSLAALAGADGVEAWQSADLLSPEGVFLGAGVFDRSDARAAWRRFSLAEGACFDERYLTAALLESIERRSEESCQCLVASDADFIPGLLLERYEDRLLLRLETAAVRAYAGVIVDFLMEALAPAEIVVADAQGRRTVSGQPLKPRWIEIDGLFYRVDLLVSGQAPFPLILREQQALVGSLCEGRRVLELFADSGAFSIQAMAQGAVAAVALQADETARKVIGANAQRNGHRVEAVGTDPAVYLEAAGPDAFDAIILDLRTVGPEALPGLLRQAFAQIAESGLVAVYAERGSGMDRTAAAAAAAAGREARVFARTSQPFDYPVLLNFPESQLVEGLVLEVL